jgi:hypothetical protein
MPELPERFVFMKVGNHAGETWEQILERKRRELERAGRTFWGYGGSACHPISQVQPFARLAVREHGSIFLVMEHIDSKGDPDLLPATEFSHDGIRWEPIPEGVSVTGSRYALILDEIVPGQLDLPLDRYEVGVGPSAGKPAEDYLQGRTDKGCFVRTQKPRTPSLPPEKLVRKVAYLAKLKEPFAVLLRHTPG